MYARYFTFKSKPEMRRTIEEMADSIFRYTKTLNGFVSATYTVSEDQTEYGSFTVWRSKEDAETAGAAIREMVMPKLEGVATAPPEIKILEVYEAQ